jgi:arylsulfatase A-like enzyme
MNIILVLIDSLNRRALSAYGPSEVATPHLTAFAQRAWRFDRHFVGSLPCMPARREIFAGTAEVLWRPWGPLEPFDARLPRLLARAGYRTAIVTDHYHYWEELANGYLQSFASAELIRGHELDFWHTPLSPDEPLPAWVEQIERWRPGQGRRYYANVRGFAGEEDYFPARVMSGAVRWLADHAPDRHTPFFLQIESFDVHEPFDVPEPYASRYGDPSRRDRFTIWPPYQDRTRLAAFMATAGQEELAFIRTQYAAKVTMVDRWFGTVLEAIDRQQLWDDTVVIVTTDHGHDLGERGVFGKEFPHWDSHAHIPLLVWDPRVPGNGRSIAALTTTIDLFATVQDAAGLAAPRGTPSRSVLPLLSGDATALHDALLYGTFGQGLCCTDGTWTVIKSPAQEGPLHYYSALLFKGVDAGSTAQIASGQYLPNVALPQWRVPARSEPLSRENYLFHRQDDPDQRHNLWNEEPVQRARMLGLLRELMMRAQAPKEQYARLGV